MFDNIYSKTYGSSNSTTVTVDGADVRYIVMFVSDGASCVMSCSVIHAGCSEPVAWQGFGYGDKITSF